jgi:hypothetical protein
MLETPHVIVGAAIASKIPNPYIAIPMAFLSHFVLEKVPHWNPHLNSETEKFGKPTSLTTKIVIIDSCLSLISGLFIASRALPNSGHALTIIFASFFAALPDLIEAPYFFLNIKNKFIKNWIILQKSLQEDAGIVVGLLTQVVTVIAAIYWIMGS